MSKIHVQYLEDHDRVERIDGEGGQDEAGQQEEGGEHGEAGESPARLTHYRTSSDPQWDRQTVNSF